MHFTAFKTLPEQPAPTGPADANPAPCAACPQLRGPWAFIVYDRGNGRIVAARDPAGAEPLFWGSTMLSEGVLFASDRWAGEPGGFGGAARRSAPSCHLRATGGGSLLRRQSLARCMASGQDELAAVQLCSCAEEQKKRLQKGMAEVCGLELARAFQAGRKAGQQLGLQARRRRRLPPAPHAPLHAGRLLRANVQMQMLSHQAASLCLTTFPRKAHCRTSVRWQERPPTLHALHAALGCHSL